MLNNTVTVSSDYKEILTKKFFTKNNISSLSQEDLQWVTEACATYYSDLMDVSILWAEDKNSALIAYHQKRYDKNLTISFVSLKEKAIQWTTVIDYNETGRMGDSTSVSEKNGYFYIVTNGSLYKLKKDSGDIEYIYEYRWNKVK